MRACGLTLLGIASAVIGLATPVHAVEAKKGFVGMQIKQDAGDGGDVTIDMIVPNSPAEKAGLQVGDIVLKVANVEAKDVQTVIKTITGFSPGDKINVEIRRNGKEETVKVTLAERPPDIDNGK